MTDERLRLFVALELPSSTRSALAQWRAGAVGEPSIRALDADSLHVTLCFLGWCDADELPDIEAACDHVSTQRAPDLQVGEALWLPRRRPRVLAVALEDAGDDLARIQDVLAQRLQDGGWYVPERRTFLAHVTVARVRRGDAPPRVQLPGPPRLSLRGERVTLFRSRLQSAGARYEALYSVVLAH